MRTPATTGTATLPRVLLAAGRYRFEEPALAEVARRDGNEAAWLAAFERHGRDAPAKVHGDFAVAVQDGRGRVFLAVDRFAIRTLCYRIDAAGVAVHERADALGEGRDDLDPQALFDYLYFHVIPGPRTIFANVKRVPAGHCVVIEGGRAATARWWRPTFVENEGGSFTALRDEFKSLLREAVRRQLDDTVTGCFLSGGTDSSTVAGMLTEVTAAPAPTFSIGFDAKGYDEMEYARIAARHFKTDHHEYYVTPDDLVATIPAVAAAYDQPFGNSSVVPSYHCAKLARESGVGRMLGGDGGDELFGGNSRYAKQRIFGVYEAVPAWMRRGILEPCLGGSSPLRRLPLLRKAASYVEQARVPMPDRIQSYNLLGRLGFAEVLTPDFLARVDTAEPLAYQREVYAEIPASALINRMLAFDWRITLADNDLPKVVGATGLAGLPVGFPLLDDALIDFSLRLAPSLKLKGLKLRWFFKEALRGFLPEQIIKKQKHGFGLPFGVWVNDHAGLRALAMDSVRAFADRNIVRREFIDRLLGSYLPQHPGYYGEMVWVMMMLEQWLQARTDAAVRPRMTTGD